MDAYLDKLVAVPVPVPVPKGEDQSLLSADGIHTFRSVSMKLRWPVSHVIPQYAYQVSALTQGSGTEITIGEAKDLSQADERSPIGIPDDGLDQPGGAHCRSQKNSSSQGCVSN